VHDQGNAGRCCRVSRSLQAGRAGDDRNRLRVGQLVDELLGGRLARERDRPDAAEHSSHMGDDCLCTVLAEDTDPVSRVDG
jgi:hypothetical protein